MSSNNPLLRISGKMFASAVILFTLTDCASVSTHSHADFADYKSRVVVHEDGGVQPVWIEVENSSSQTLWLLRAGTDPDYFSPLAQSAALKPC